MLKLLRRILSFACFIALLVCIALVVLWVRSRHVADFLGRKTYDFDPAMGMRNTTSAAGLFSASGRLAIGHIYGRNVDVAAFAPKPTARHEAHWTRESQRLAYGVILDPPSDDLPSPGECSRWVWRGAGVYLAEFFYPYDTGSTGYEALVIPYHLIVPITAIPGVWSVVAVISLVRRLVAHVRGAHRQRRGLCPACGYDLRASQQTCPECGASLVRQPKAPLLSASG